MREAGRVVAQAHQIVAENIRPGVTSKHLDQLVEEFFVSQGAIPAFKDYQGYPASICTSVNEIVVHGIPNDIPFEEGWIVSVDIGAFVDGFCGDSAWTYPVGVIDTDIQKLLEVTKE